MAAIVTPKVAKRQRLTNNDCGDAINKFAEKSSVVYSAFSNYFETKQKLTTAAFCFNCWTSWRRVLSPSSSLRILNLHSSSDVLSIFIVITLDFYLVFMYFTCNNIYKVLQLQFSSFLSISLNLG
jgi:hypothetical protein